MKNNHKIILIDHSTGDSEGNEAGAHHATVFLSGYDCARWSLLTTKQRALISAYSGNQDWNSSRLWCIEHIIMLIVWVV